VNIPRLTIRNTLALALVVSAVAILLLPRGYAQAERLRTGQPQALVMAAHAPAPVVSGRETKVIGALLGWGANSLVSGSGSFVTYGVSTILTALGVDGGGGAAPPDIQGDLDSIQMQLSSLQNTVNDV
jgi:hypothetical protein